MNKKILMAFVLLIVAVATISFVGAAQDVSVSGIQFSLPDGFEPSEDTGTNTSGVGVYYGDNGVILILVTEDSAALEDVQTNGSYSEKTIAGQKGYIFNDPEDGSAIFAYSKDNNFVFVGAPDETTIESLIK